MKRLLCLALAMLMLCACFVSCGEDETVGDDTVQETVVEAPVEGLPAPSSVNIAGEFNILVSGNYAWNDFATVEGERDTVQEAIYRRNELLKQDYGVEVITDDVIKFGSTNGSGTGYQKLYNEYVAGESTYDAASVGTYDVASLAYTGLLWDLNSVPYIDLTKDYWDQQANEDLAVLGKMYYTNGDIGVVNNKVTHAILFNKNMVDDYGMADPYELVRNNNWTLETFSGLVKQVGEDKNLDGVYNENDMYGLLTWNDPMVAVLASSDAKIAGVNDAGEIELTLYNERTVTLYDKFTDLVFDSQHVYNYQYDSVTGKATSSSVWNTNRDNIFNESRAVFYLNTVATIERHRDSDVEFGVLPYPKLDATQEEYGHSVSAYHSQFICIPLMAKNVTKSGIVLEYLAAKGQEIVRPAYYDITLNGKSVRDEESSEMLDIIFASRVYDIGAYYKIGTYNTQLGAMFVSRDSLTVIYETYRNQAETYINQVNGIFARLG